MLNNKMVKAKKRTEKYTYALGRRKNAIATIRLFKGEGEDIINGKSVKEIYQTKRELRELYQPLNVTDNRKNFHFSVKTAGGGKSGQLDAIILALARALVNQDEDNKQELKKQKLLTVDSRVKERKKPGLKKARKKEQFSKR